MAVLQLLLLWLLVGIGGTAQGAESLEEEASGQAVGEEELLEDDGVLVLKQQSFAQALLKHRLLLVAFCDPLSGHCQALVPEFAKAAAILRNDSSGLRLAKVDTVQEEALSQEFGVTSYPILLLFRDGNRTHPTEFTGLREAEDIVKWLRRKAGPSTVLLEDEAGAAAFLEDHAVAVVGFFHDLQDEAVRLFSDVASEASDAAFALTDSARLFQAYNISGDTVSLFRKQEDPRADFLVDEDLGLDATELAQFITVQSLAPVMEFTRKNSSRIFGAKIPHHLLLFINKTEASQLELLGPFQDAAAPFRGQVLFVLADVNGEGAPVLLYFGLKSSDAPAIRFVTIETNTKYRLAPNNLTAAVISTFCQDALGGRIQPHLSTQEIPEDWDKHPVKILVGKNFEQVAFDPTKNVFVKFYAPWCPHSKAMAGVWEELGNKYKDHPDIIIAEMDATMNEVAELPIQAYPSLYYFPAGQGREMREYRSTRDLDTFSSFLENGGVLPPSEESVEAAETITQETGTSAPEMPDSRDEL
ncbi:protein disulfide-isomerase A2 [Tiliqua scincoides]|uniref:protein disulfide-isomerase A2 n=1 Tax=Tiliqua scincoides TaxID=71010 RepID=UPI00346332AA